MATSIPQTESLRVHRLQDGGFVVMANAFDNDGRFNPPVFACTSTAELLAYITKTIGGGR